MARKIRFQPQKHDGYTYSIQNRCIVMLVIMAGIFIYLISGLINLQLSSGDEYAEKAGESSQPRAPYVAKHKLHRLPRDQRDKDLEQLYAEGHEPAAKAKSVYPVFKLRPALVCAKLTNIWP